MRMNSRGGLRGEITRDERTPGSVQTETELSEQWAVAVTVVMVMVLVVWKRKWRSNRGETGVEDFEARESAEWRDAPGEDASASAWELRLSARAEWVRECERGYGCWHLAMVIGMDQPIYPWPDRVVIDMGCVLC